jgi:hypothetical protein
MGIEKSVIRCHGPIHTQHSGNILLAYKDNSIFVKCNDRACKRWTNLTINIPGINLNLSDAGITQEVLPEDYHLHLAQAMTVVAKRAR